jgi:hypothetical protein
VLEVGLKWVDMAEDRGADEIMRTYVPTMEADAGLAGRILKFEKKIERVLIKIS